MSDPLAVILWPFAGLSWLALIAAYAPKRCCAHCARGRNHNAKPQRMARRQARAVERRETAVEVIDQTAKPGLIDDPICPVSGDICDDCIAC